MKKISSLLSLLIIAACSPKDDLETGPTDLTIDFSGHTKTDLNALLGIYYQNTGEVIFFDKDLIVEAYVVSSDEAGNFYKELVVQDKPENPLAGISIKLNMNSYYQFFNLGRKIQINLKGLSLGNSHGVPSLGVGDGKHIENIPQSRISYHLARTAEVSEITPKSVKAADFDDRLKNLFVKIEDVQFNKLLTNPSNLFTYASQDNDEFDGERLVESCTGDFPFILSTSTYSDFGMLKLPQGSGSLQGILTRDYYDKFYTIYLNSPADINFNSSSRCDPKELACGMVSAHGKKILFEDDFTSQKNNKAVNGNDWKNLIQEGSRSWEAYTATGANASLGKSVRMRPGGSGDERSIGWLITPRINFDGNSGEVLSFKTSTSFANGSFLEVLISTNWDGAEENLLKAEWQVLSQAYIAQNNDFFGDWISSGTVDLSCVTGKGYIAFRYTGSDLAYYNGVYELDDIMVSAD